MIKIGIDASLRSTGISILNDDNLIKNYIYQPTEKQYEKLIIETTEFYHDLFNNLIHQYDISKVNLESLSFNSISSTKDIIATCHWNLRCILYELDLDVNIVSPAQWRKHCRLPAHPVYPTMSRPRHRKQKRRRPGFQTTLSHQRIDGYHGPSQMPGHLCW